MLIRSFIASGLVLAALGAAHAQSSNIYILNEGGAVQSLGALQGARRIAVSEAGRNLLVLDNAGHVWAWQGTGFAPVEGLADATAIAAGTLHGVALKADGSVWTWGANEQGQLGDGTLVSRAQARAVPGLHDIVQIAAGPFFTLALGADGTVWAFGSNWSEIAAGDARRMVTEPVVIGGLDGIEAIAVRGGRGYARNRERAIRAWGKTADPASSGVIELLGPEVSADVVRRFDSHRPVSGVEVALPVDGQILDADSGWTLAVIALKAGAANGTESSTAAGAEPDADRLAQSAMIAAAAAGGGPRQGQSQQILTSAMQHSLVIKSDGTVCGWGNNDTGQLGDGTVVERRSPVTAAGLAGIAGIATGGTTFRGHSFALRSDGTVWSWGSNNNSELGDGTIFQKPTPDPLPGLTGITAVSAGGIHGLALKNDGTVWAWGFNGQGQLGDGTNTGRDVPVQVVGLTGVVAISAGGVHSMALKSDGTVWTWGQNNRGQLGNSSFAASNVIVQVTGLTGVSGIAAGGEHSMALKSNGEVWTWGYNFYGQLGDNSNTSRNQPVRAGTLAGIVSIAAGAYHSLAARNDGTGWAWGQNTNGQLGDVSTTSRNVPVQVNGLTGAVRMSGGDDFSAASRADGTLFAWGENGRGQLGNGTTTDSLIPVAVSACASGVFPAVGRSTLQRRVSAAESHSYAVRGDGTVWSWGRNDTGQLGDGTTTDRSAPVQVSGLSGILAVSAGGSTFRGHGIAVRNDGTAWTWGSNNLGELGDGTNIQRPVPVQVPGLTGIVAASAGWAHTLAVKDNGTVWAWGLNGSGQLGDGTTTGRNLPVQVIGLTNVIAVAAGTSHSLALKSDGTVWAWGLNNRGQIGDNTVDTRLVAVQVPRMTGVIAIAASNDHNAVLRADGTVWGWGYNFYGDLGEGGSGISRVRPVRASDLTQVVGIEAGTYQTIAVKRDGTVWAWGNNDDGQLGDASVVTRHVPVRTGALISFGSAVAVAMGVNHSFALRSDGSIWSWGSNAFGQFGTASPANSTVPVSAFQHQAGGFNTTSNVGIFRFGFFWLEDVNGDRNFTIPPDRAFAFGGATGDVAIAGDWNGDGRSKVGIYRPSNGFFLLDYDGDGNFDAGVDRFFSLGVGVELSDVPVVGDWNGSGFDKVGLFRQGFFWILDTNGNGVFQQNVDQAIAYGGVNGDLPVVGDWDGDGRDNLGLFRLGFFWILDFNGNFAIDNVNAPGGDRAFPFGGVSGDVPVVGDWNGNGIDKVGVFRAGFFWVVDANGNTSFDGTGGGQDLAFAFGGLSNDKPLVGKW